MPRKTEWTRRIEPVLAELGSLSSPWIDRTAVARLFGVSPRQALRILHRLGAGLAGEALLIERSTLMVRLEELAQDESVRFELARHERVADELHRVRKRSVAATLRLPAVPSELAALVGVTIAPGLVQVQFQTAEELLARLLALAHLAADDMDAFRAAVGVPAPE